MKNEYSLLIVKRGGNIEIPFLGLKELDVFTMEFNNEEHLVNNLFEIFDLNDYIKYVQNVFVVSRNWSKLDNKGNPSEKYLDVRYVSDNYDKEDLLFVFSNYLKDDRMRILKHPIRFVSHDSIYNFVKYNGQLTDLDIDLVVKTYLKKSYRKQRDTYFLLKKANYKVMTKKIRNRFKTQRTGTDLSKFDAANEYFEWLQRRVLEDPESFADVMDELSGYSIDELQSGMRNPYFGVVDGATSDQAIDYDKVYLLEGTTGYRIDALKRMISGVKKSKR